MADNPASCCGGGCRQESGAAVSGLPERAAVSPRPNPASHRWSRRIGGAFIMGASDPSRFPLDGEGPTRTVTLSEFSISCYAVTNAQFADFVRDTGYVTDAERFGWSFVFDALVPAETRRQVSMRSAETPWWQVVLSAYWAQPEGPHTTVLDRLHHPVVHVSWDDARAYCRWAEVRLPTEAEWECAARGGLENALYPWGDELTPAGEHRCNIWQGSFPDYNSAEDGYVGTAPVDAYAPNGFGLYNMAGNVWEWCEDTFSPSYHRITAANNPLCREPSASRSIRGGSFLCHESYCNRYRVAARSSNTPDSSSSNIGFRVVDAWKPCRQPPLE